MAGLSSRGPTAKWNSMVGGCSCLLLGVLLLLLSSSDDEDDSDWLVVGVGA